MLYKESKAAAKKIPDYIRSNYHVRIRLVGSIRRKKEVNADVDLLIIAPEDKFKQIYLPDTFREVERGDQRIRYFGHVKVDLFRTDADCLPFALLHHTGNKTYNIRVRAHAKAMGYKLNQYGLFHPDGSKVGSAKKFKSERDVLKFLGVTYKTPSEREE